MSVFKTFYNTLPFLCAEMLLPLLGLNTLIKKPKTEVDLKHITFVSKGNGKQK